MMAVSPTSFFFSLGLRFARRLRSRPMTSLDGAAR